MAVGEKRNQEGTGGQKGWPVPLQVVVDRRKGRRL
jgi:hypothetical protein